MVYYFPQWWTSGRKARITTQAGSFSISRCISKVVRDLNQLCLSWQTNYSWCPTTIWRRRPDLQCHLLSEKTSQVKQTAPISTNRRKLGKTTCTAFNRIASTTTSRMLTLASMITCCPFLMRSSASKWWTALLNIGTPTRLTGILIEASKSILTEPLYQIRMPEGSLPSYSWPWPSTRSSSLPWRLAWESIVYLASNQALLQPTCPAAELPRASKHMPTNAITLHKILPNSNSRWKPL